MTENDCKIVDLSPRHIWLRKRVIEVINSLKELEKIKDWESYQQLAFDLSKELNYATCEWGRYYRD